MECQVLFYRKNEMLNPQGKIRQILSICRLLNLPGESSKC